MKGNHIRRVDAAFIDLTILASAAFSTVPSPYYFILIDFAMRRCMPLNVQ